MFHEHEAVHKHLFNTVNMVIFDGGKLCDCVTKMCVTRGCNF